MNETEEPDANQPAGRSPGTELARARQARDMTLEAVAESTGIPLAVLAALEADDWGQLDAPVYVRGYLRKYARLLDLNQEALIEAYESSAAPADPEIHSYVSEHLPVQRNVRWLLPVTGLVVIAVLVLMGLWSWRHFQHRVSPAQVPASAVSAMMALTNAGAATTAAPGSRSAAPPALAATAGGKGAAGEAGGVHLHLQVQQPSWIEVYGPGHKRLYYNLAAAGTELDFHAGQGSLDVFLGNAEGVNVKVNGNDYRIPPADRSSHTAHFSVAAGPQHAAPAETRR